MPNQYTLEDEPEFIEEDERAEVIKNLTDDEEIDAAIELIKEKYDAPGTDTASAESEPDKPNKGEDTSEEAEDKTEFNEEEENAAEEKNKSEKEFLLTEEIINQQPEEYRAILMKYKDKPREELEKAIVNAVLFKNDKDLIKALISVQKEIGKTDKEPEPKPIEKSGGQEKFELPVLPEEDETIKSILQQETIKRLKKLYPDMPEDMNSEEYKEWERELLETGGFLSVNKYLRDLETINNDVKTELRKVIYAQTHLKNLYNESPTELLPLLNDENLTKLKNINDNFREINNKALEEEVKIIKSELDKYGITEKDLGIDLTLTKDENGSYYNEFLNSLMLNGDGIDTNVIGRIGRIPLLKKGQLAKKFIYENNAKILTQIVNNKSKKTRTEVERLKDENLKIPTGTKGSKTVAVNPDEIQKITDDATLDKIIESIKNKYSY